MTNQFHDSEDLLNTNGEPRNSGARQSSPHVSINLLEGGKPPTPIQPYTRRQLEMLGETQQKVA